MKEASEVETLLPNAAGADNAGFYVNGAGNHTNLQADDGNASSVEIQLGFGSVQVEDLLREAAGVSVVSAPQRNIGGGYALYSDSFASPAGGGVEPVPSIRPCEPERRTAGRLPCRAPCDAPAGTGHHCSEQSVG
jgi:hypothetical protein